MTARQAVGAAAITASVLLIAVPALAHYTPPEGASSCTQEGTWQVPNGSAATRAVGSDWVTVALSSSAGSLVQSPAADVRVHGDGNTYTFSVTGIPASVSSITVSSLTTWYSGKNSKKPLGTDVRTVVIAAPAGGCTPSTEPSAPSSEPSTDTPSTPETTPTTTDQPSTPATTPTTSDEPSTPETTPTSPTESSPDTTSTAPTTVTPPASSSDSVSPSSPTDDSTSGGVTPSTGDRPRPHVVFAATSPPAKPGGLASTGVPSGALLTLGGVLAAVGLGLCATGRKPKGGHR